MKGVIDRLSSFWLAAGQKNSGVIFIDALCLSAAVYLGYALRLTFFITSGYRVEMLASCLLFSGSVLLAFYIGRIYRILWPQASVEEYARLFKFYCLGAVLYALLLWLVKGYVGPRSSVAILVSLGIIFLGGVRASWRLMHVTRQFGGAVRRRALIIGAGDAGTQLARDMTRNDSKLLPVGFIDENPALWGMYVASLKVFGGSGALRRTVVDEGVEIVLIAIPSASGSQISSYLDILSDCNVSVRVLPSLLDLADGQVTVSRLRSVSLEDLLRRESVTLDDSGIAGVIEGKCVLVTGAGGSIGSEICRQALARKPKRLLALGHGEQSIYLLMESLTAAKLADNVSPIVADIADAEAMEAVFRDYAPDVVFHAAAHKHVPLMEDNPREALRVNALGTWTLAELAGRYNVGRFVMISTDKAVNPTSIMGATKRAAERLLFAVQRKYPATRYMAVRFGNVLGSRGSVVPKFEKQIENGGPVTVTHKDMKRYFMLIPEAVALVLQAGTMGGGGELFVLDMGEPVNIADMARTLIRLHGYEPDTDIEIVYTGVRPGEKLYEELFYDTRYVARTSHDKIYLSRISAAEADIIPVVRELLEGSASGAVSDSELRRGIMELADGA